MRTGRARRVTLLTDFGTADGYVAAMKGVIGGIAPFAIIDDSSHDIPPGDIHAAAWALGAYWRVYPPGTVHVAVVDPGVGSERRALACELDGRIVVAPDNGLITHALLAATERRVFRIETSRPLSDTEDRAPRREPVSATFHGRDIFAPAAARILTGTPLADIGSVVQDPVLIEYPAIEIRGSMVLGVIVHIDRFGNLITNIPASALNAGDSRSVSTAGSAVVRVSGLGIEPVHDDGVPWNAARRALAQGSGAIPLRRTYADVDSGVPIALIGSRGVLEVSVRDGSAERLLGAGRGDVVEWSPAR